MEPVNPEYLFHDDKNDRAAQSDNAAQPANPYHANPMTAPNPYGTWGQRDASAAPVGNPYQNFQPETATPYPGQPPLEDFRQLPSTPTPRARMGFDPSQLYRPRWTYVFLGLIIAAFVGQVATGYSLSSGNKLGTLTDWGVLYKPLVLDGEWWRLITPIFLHFGLQHILFNSLALLVFGMQLEQWFGGKRFVAIFFLTGIAGNLVTLLATTQDGAISAGASGAIFGILGASLAFFYRNRNNLGAYGQSALRNMVINAGLNLAFTFGVPGISITAHLGGLVAGLFLGYFLSSPQLIRLPSPATNTGNRLAPGPAGTVLQLWWPAAALAVAEIVAFLMVR